MSRNCSESPQPQIFSKLNKMDSHGILLIDHGPRRMLKRMCLGFSDKKCLVEFCLMLMNVF